MVHFASFYGVGMILWDPFGSTAENAPPIFFCLAKRKCAVHGGKEKRLVQTRPCGQVWGCGRLTASFPQTCQVPSECAMPWQSFNLQAASRNVVFYSGVLIEAPYLWPRCRSVGGVSKEGAAAPSLCRLKGWSRRGRPKSPSWRVFWTVHGPFSPRGENGGCIAHLHRGVTYRCRQASSSKEMS